MGPRDEDIPVSEDEVEAEAEKEKLRPNPPEEMEMRKIPLKTKDGHPEVIVGQPDPFCKVHHLRYLLLGFNGFVVVLGIALLAATVWVRADKEFGDYEEKLHIDNFYAVCAMLITAAVVILFVGVLGCMGAVSEQRWMLILYMTIFGLIFLIELAALVIMWSAPYSTKINAELEKQLRRQIDSRMEDDSSRTFMDFIQGNLYCCGASSVKDYGGMDTPKSCSDERSGSVFNKGCASQLLLYLRAKAGIIGGLALPILFVQLLAIVASGCLIRRVAGDSKYIMGD